MNQQHWISNNENDNPPTSEVWILKDKDGNPPPPEECEKCMNLLRKLNLARNLLFPCPRSPDELEMEKKDSETAPREMNIFMVFRRQLAHVLKEQKLSDDGKILSRNASYIWNGASEDEKRSYALIAEELKRRHLERYPNYTYERRKRKAPEEEFILIGTETFKKTKKKRKVLTPQTRVKSSPVQENCAPVSTSLAQGQEKGWSYNSLTIPTSDNSLDNMLIQQSYQIYSGIESYNNNNYPEESCDHYQVGDESIPLLANNIMSQNFTNVSLQQLQQIQQQQLQYQQLQQQPQLPQPSPPPSYYLDYFTNGGNPGIGEPLDDLFALERPIDEVVYRYGNLNS